MRSHLLRYGMPAAFVSAIVGVLALGVTAAQAYVFHADLPGAASHGTTVGLTIAAIALAVFVIGDIAYATVVERRRPALAEVGELKLLRRDETAPEQERKAA
jgi:hypothetical protein